MPSQHSPPSRKIIGSMYFGFSSRPDPRGWRRVKSPTRSVLAPNTLTFHFDRLRQAGLIDVKREGRSMIYAARYETMNGLLSFLSQNCCAGVSKSSAAASPLLTPGSGAEKMSQPDLKTVAIIGAGPVGLAAAAHLITRNIPVKVYETGDTIAANVRRLGPRSLVFAMEPQYRSSRQDDLEAARLAGTARRRIADRQRSL